MIFIYLLGVAVTFYMFRKLNKQDDSYLHTPFLGGLGLALLSWVMALIYGFVIMQRKGTFDKIYNKIENSKLAKWFTGKY